MPQSDPIDPVVTRNAGKDGHVVLGDSHANAPRMTDPAPSDKIVDSSRTVSSSGFIEAPGRWNRGAWLFRNSTLQQIEFLLDEAFRVPGTKFRFGIDGIIGLVPGLGDVLAGLLSLIIPIAAWIRGVPYITLVRMAANIGIGLLVGSIPLFGDIFLVAWKANRRNYQLLTLHLDEPHRHTGRDWAFLGILAASLGLIFAIPIALVVWLVFWLISH
jgi:hypothetical protein